MNDKDFARAESRFIEIFKKVRDRFPSGLPKADLVTRMRGDQELKLREQEVTSNWAWEFVYRSRLSSPRAKPDNQHVLFEWHEIQTCKFTAPKELWGRSVKLSTSPPKQWEGRWDGTITVERDGVCTLMAAAVSKEMAREFAELGFRSESVTIEKMRADLTHEDNDQISVQKKDNIKRAVEADEQWDWECSLINPLLKDHPDWVTRDAYNHVLSENGGVFPKRPKKRD